MIFTDTETVGLKKSTRFIYTRSGNLGSGRLSISSSG